jgi:hypothetical protein
MTEERVSQMIQVQDEALQLFKKKNTDYGDAFANFGAIGVIVRMGDKIQRLISVTNNGINLVNTEGIRDTLIDLHNYSAMAIMLIDENNNTEKKEKLMSQIEAEGTKQIEELNNTKVFQEKTVFEKTINKIMADGCEKLAKETGRTGITYSELRQMYG